MGTLNYLSNFEMPLINCEINLDLNCVKLLTMQIKTQHSQ